MKLLKSVTFGLSILAVSSFALASGSHSSGSMKMSKGDYNKGKMIVHKQIMCDSCPMKSASLDKSTAKDIMMKLKKGDASLGSFQKAEVKSVVVYLEDRFSM